jgi:hypothetical protein
MPAEIEPALREKLKGRPVDSIPVEIEFVELPLPGQLEKLGLHLEGYVAWGSLDYQRIELIAAMPQVRAVRLSHRPAEAGPSPGPPQIGLNLQSALDDPAVQEFSVVITFRSPHPENVEGMTVQGSRASARLTREQLNEWLVRGDVLAIELSPTVQLLKSKDLEE